jgi:hypothetical protein
MRAILMGTALAASLLLASPGDAQDLRYWGQRPETATAVIELGPRHYYEIVAGTEIPAWGRVKEVRDDRLVVEQERTETDKEALRQQGLLDYDVLEIHIPREDLRHPEATASPRLER